MGHLFEILCSILNVLGCWENRGDSPDRESHLARQRRLFGRLVVLGFVVSILGLGIWAFLTK